MYWCLQLIYTWRDCNEWKTEKYHERTNMGKVTQPKLWWQLYVTSLSERNIQNFGPLDLCWTECMSAWEKNLSYKYTHTHAYQVCHTIFSHNIYKHPKIWCLKGVCHSNWNNWTINSTFCSKSCFTNISMPLYPHTKPYNNMEWKWHSTHS